MGKKKKQQQATLAATNQALAEAQARSAAQAAALQAAQQRDQAAYLSRLDSANKQIEALSAQEPEAPQAQRVGMAADEAAKESRRRSRSRYGLSSTVYAGRGGFGGGSTLLG